MVEHGAENPYAPGTGNKPPHLAGRAREKYQIETALERIRIKPMRTGSWDRSMPMLRRMIGKKAPEKPAILERVSPPLVLIGPRGVGKTALLGWAKLRAEELGMRYAVISEKLLGGPEESLGRAVMGPKEYYEAAKEITTTLSSGHSATTGFDEKGQATHPAAVMSFESIIDMQLRKGPLLLILDEAHAVAPTLLKEFCIAVQGYIDESRPLALIMAGTPGLRGKLRGIGATFMERSKFLSLSLLALEEAREALSKPASDSGVPMDEDALEKLVEWTDCYPFFIQLAGETVWEIAKGRGSSKITLEDANQALEAAEDMREDFYDGRYQELDERGVVAYALQVIDLIEGQPGRQISYQDLIDGIQDANNGMEHKKTVEIYKSLLNLGFIYKNKAKGGYDAGIPSMFEYVKEQKKGLRSKVR